MPAKVKAKPSPKSLTQFVREKKRAGCTVCALPADVLAQIADARSKKIQRATVLEWLRAECGTAITSGDFDRHHNGRHDRDE